MTPCYFDLPGLRPAAGRLFTPEEYGAVALRSDPAAALREGSHGGTGSGAARRTWSVLLAGQVAVALTLTFGARRWPPRWRPSSRSRSRRAACRPAGPPGDAGRPDDLSAGRIGASQPKVEVKGDIPLPTTMLPRMVPGGRLRDRGEER